MAEQEQVAMAIIESPVAASDSRRRQGWSLSGGAFDSPTPPLPPTAESIEAARAAQQAERAQFTELTGVDLDQDGAIVLPPCVVARLEER